MQWVIIIIVAIVWIIAKASEGASGVSLSVKTKQVFNEERNKKYKDRVSDPAKSLFERNTDIIENFAKQVTAHSEDNRGYSYGRRHSYGNYFFENLTRDCVNEIALAEDKFGVKPSIEYLSNWKPKAPKDWQELATQIETSFREKQNQLKEVENNIWRHKAELDKAKTGRNNPVNFKKIEKKEGRDTMCIGDISLILSTDLHSWTEFEKGLTDKPYEVKPFPLFSSRLEVGHDLSSVHVLNNEINEFNKILENDTQQGNDVRDFFKNISKGYIGNKKEDVVERFNFVLNSITLPPSVPKIWDIDFDPEQGILIVEIKLPDVVHNQVFKEVALKKGAVKKPITLKEQREIVPNIHPAIMLKTAYEIFRNDYADIIKLLVLNGWVEFDDPATGNKTRTYTASLTSNKEQITQLKLSKLDPVSAFAGLKGKSAGRLIDIIPISPMMSLNKKDKRFIETKEVLGSLDVQTNLASMDWQDFENLIAELFQKEFSEEGAEIKLTQSSRDKGVDAIVFNPDPIRGGKYVIQAKRYTNTVDVSAVRDLVAVVAHEGASRGILVTTSTFGADAYAFVQNKPITLLDGPKLLGLLEKHGYKFRVNLAEARKLYPSNQKY